VVASILTIFFDLSRIASLGAIFYLVMDVGVHWGVLRYLRKQVNANLFILLTAIILDLVVLGAFLAIKAKSDMTIVIVAVIGIAIVFIAEGIYLRMRPALDIASKEHHSM